MKFKELKELRFTDPVTSLPRVISSNMDLILELLGGQIK
jgi:hypothetical protein